MKKRILLLLLVSAASLHAKPGPGAPGSPIIPLQPKELLSYMPAAPAGWRVTQSMARNNFSDWITVYAERTFEQIPPPPAPGAPAKPSPPATMRVHLVDTGFSSELAPSFAPSKSESAPQDLTYLKINDFPARLSKTDDKNMVLTFLIKDRYTVEILAKNLSDDKLKSIVEAFDFKGLMAVPDVGEKGLPWPAVITKIDELNPQNNGSCPIYWMRGK